jgi:hypothetical protein
MKPLPIAAVVLAAIASAIYVLRLDPYAGLLFDDAWYIVLGKALAGGEGFRMISSSVAPIMPTVPPGFPALLAVVFAIAPSYPDNLILLKAVSMAAMAGVGVACWIDLTRYREVPGVPALCIAFAVVLTPSFVFLATSTVMAEGVFTLAQLVTVLAVERAVRRERMDWRGPAVAGVMGAVTMLIRTAGLAVLAASIVYLVLQRRWRQAAIFAVTAAACLLPWQLHARVNAPTYEERLAHGGTFAFTYEQLLAMERPGAADTDVSGGEMAVRVGRNLTDVLLRDVGAAIVPAIYRGPNESGEEVLSVGRPGRGSMGVATGTMVVSGLLCLGLLMGIIRSRAWFSLPALLVGATIAMILPVAALTFRYVIPVLPFLLLFLWRGVARPSVARILLLTVLGFHVVDHVLFLREKATSTPPWTAQAGEVETLLVWMSENLKGPGAVASTNPGLVYLRTGRKGVASAAADENWDRWKTDGVRYVAALRPTSLPARHRQARLLFQTKGRLWVVEM